MAFNMPLPKLRHPIPVKIRKRLDTTPQNPNTKEPLGKPQYGPQISLFAQVSDRKNMVKPESGGKIIVYDGYLCFLQTDLENAGIEIGEGDLVEEIGSEDSLRTGLKLYVENITYRGHNPLKGGHTLVKAWLKDKGPVKGGA